ncbi:hypothetical protein GLOTRDRAFT_131815 [Gloeophyllum trabeum ATCC 11539]|uniref:DNA polymerase delta subunit 3 n=1 Tax=Gloeophyllum trabeum (strain ATCC 11539 / FP-39264 / Madison 617) TaxID=670483 RepID=S7PYQ4_GLOTA|nr:uncharacterized protein GLOTRDRAFT_131815 [Gloeophyllum trabeum ATCC 11539]EPQ52583.1 hypothetical protein GLOTRDRAFT_131815 [Gloeophyllum trabeum ATCC 11539]
MSTQAANDYLTKKLTITKGIVTFRSLSRDLKIHVSSAKTELASFHAASRESGRPVHATYIITGEVSRQPLNSEDDGEMEADDEDQGFEDGAMKQMKVLLVGEGDVEKSKSQFSRILSMHVYSLSPARPQDAALICEPTESVRQADAKNGPEVAAALGRIVGADVQMRATGKKGKQPAASSSIKKASAPATPVVSKLVEPKSAGAKTDKDKDKACPTKDEVELSTSDVKEEVAPEPEKKKDKSKGKSMADWMKSQPKETKKQEKKAEPKDTKPITHKTETATKPELKAKSEDEKSITKDEHKAPPKRGIKRKSAVGTTNSDFEEKSPSQAGSLPVSRPPTESAGKVKVKKGVLLSDDEDDTPRLSKSKGKGKAKASVAEMDSEAEKSLKAMMDIDDGLSASALNPTMIANVGTSYDIEQVIKASRSAPEESAQDEDVDMAEAAEEEMKAPEPTKSKPRKKKEKKEVPVGRNGLKKKRVVKSRMKIDEKGYMVTEDYSSYESVDEEEPETPPPKSKGKSKSKARVTEDAEETEGKTKPKASARASEGGPKPANNGRPSASSRKASGQQGLANFFQSKAKK